MKPFIHVTLALLIFTLVVACESVPQQLVQNNNKSFDMDETIGTYHKGQDKELLLVTITEEAHLKLSSGRNISNKDYLPPRYELFLKRLSTQFGLKRVADWHISNLGIRCFVFQHNNPELNNDWLNSIKKTDFVEEVQTLKIHQVATRSYNDPLLDMQSGLKTLQANESHRWATGSGVKIAIIDTGLDTQHIELKNKASATYDYVFQDEDQQRFQEDIHGTAIAGVIVANANNDSGIVGVAPDANIVAIKACWQEQKKYSAAFCNTYTLSKAINYAINLNVDVINLSLAGPPDPLLEQLLLKALEKNIIVVGSIHPKLKNSFPSNVDKVIAVTDKALTQNFSKSFNDYTVSAPGKKILSTGPNDQYDFYSGSSISTAHVSGVISLLRERKPHLSPELAFKVLHNTTSPKGYINACYAITSLIGAGDC